MVTTPSTGSRNYPDSPFVGRGPELAALREALEGALEGHGRIVLVTGEPGIGKTRTAEEILGSATQRGAIVLWGRCQEWEGAPVYWPWLQILRRYVERVDEDTIRSDLNGLAGDLSQIMPDMAEFASGAPDNLSSYSPEQRRFRQFDAMARLLRIVVGRQPVVLVLDDIHWADQPSLRLLEFVAQDVHELPLLLIATYRNVDLDRRHPLTATLAELSRDPASRRIILHGLASADVRRYIELTSDRTPSPRLVNAVMAETEGNPFFMTEVVGWLRLEGQLDGEGDTRQVTIRIPESIREAVGNRLDRLPSTTNEMLTVAAVVGREFDLQLLERAGGRDTLELLDDLDQAVQAGVIEELDQPGSYRFSHALIRETLYSELTSSRRLRLHATIGTAIESLYASELSPRYAELAHHFTESTLAGNADKAIDYAIQAGEQALERLAFEGAIAHLESALNLIGTASSPSRLTILFSLSNAYQALGDFVRSKALALASVELARMLDRPEDIVRGAQLYTGGDFYGTWSMSDPQAVMLLREAIELAPEDDLPLQIDLRRRLVQYLPMSGASHTERRSLADEAVFLAGRSGDRVDLIRAQLARHIALSLEGPDSYSPCTMAETQALRRAIRELKPDGGEAYLVPWMAWSSMNETLITGSIDMTGLRTWLDQFLVEIEQIRIPAYIAGAHLLRMMSLAMEGRFVEAEHMGAQLAGSFDRALLFDGAWPGQYLFVIYREQCRLEAFAAELDRFAREDHDWEIYWRIRAILLLLETGEAAEAARQFAELARDDFSAILSDWAWLENTVTLGEIAYLLDDREQAARVLARLEPHANLNAAVRFGSDFIGSVAHYLGLLATTLERWDDAERHFQSALQRHEFMQLPPYIANTQHQYAAMLIKRGDRADIDRARGMNEQALAAAREMGMVRLERLATALVEKMKTRAAFQPASANPYDLTPREVDVLRCLTLGGSDREIAEQLSISHRTVQVHVSNILGKLGTGSRTAATALAIRERLV